ncbi:MAG: hypothetical protein K6E40_13260 [Desulfovibrio sp.]|nr:hypothetical protein [Desulfovibrio sp.]
MNLIETCMQEGQNLEQNRRQDAQTEVPAEVPTEVSAETAVPETLAETQDAPAGAEQAMHAEEVQEGLQNGRQNLPADDPDDPAKGSQGQAQAVPDASAAGTSEELLEELMPPKRERPAMENVTMRLSPEIKLKAKALAHERGMSLSEFCAQVIDRLVRKATEKKSQAA